MSGAAAAELHVNNVYAVNVQHRERRHSTDCRDAGLAKAMRRPYDKPHFSQGYSSKKRTLPALENTVTKHWRREKEEAYLDAMQREPVVACNHAALAQKLSAGAFAAAETRGLLLTFRAAEGCSIAASALQPQAFVEVFIPKRDPRLQRLVLA